MAMTLRLSEEETERLRVRAEREGISMQELAKKAIAQYVADRAIRVEAAIDDILQRDRELLERLSK